VIKAVQRPFALAFLRLYKSTSIDAALILAKLLPLHLKIQEIVANKSFSVHASLLPHSSFLVAVDVPDMISPSHIHLPINHFGITVRNCCTWNCLISGIMLGSSPPRNNRHQSRRKNFQNIQLNI
jgi:hypothetical protein